MTSMLLAALVSLSISTGRAADLASASAARATPHATAFPGWSPLGAPDDPLDGLARSDEDLRDAFAAPPSAQWLQRDLRSGDLARELSAIRGASRPHNTDAIAPISGVLLRLDRPASLRAAAALALGRIHDLVAATSLLEALKDPDAGVRASVALALGRLHARLAAPDLERQLILDPAWTARYAAAVALSKFPGADAPLAAALAADPAWQVRQQAARSLQFLPTPRAMHALTRALLDEDASVRASAAFSLGEVGGPAERRALSLAVRVETDPAARLLMNDAERVALARR